MPPPPPRLRRPPARQLPLPLRQRLRCHHRTASAAPRHRRLPRRYRPRPQVRCHRLLAHLPRQPPAPVVVAVAVVAWLVTRWWRPSRCVRHLRLPLPAPPPSAPRPSPRRRVVAVACSSRLAACSRPSDPPPRPRAPAYSPPARRLRAALQHMAAAALRRRRQAKPHSHSHSSSSSLPWPVPPQWRCRLSLVWPSVHHVVHQRPRRPQLRRLRHERSAACSAAAVGEVRGAGWLLWQVLCVQQEVPVLACPPCCVRGGRVWARCWVRCPLPRCCPSSRTARGAAAGLCPTVGHPAALGTSEVRQVREACVVDKVCIWQASLRGNNTQHISERPNVVLLMGMHLLMHTSNDARTKVRGEHVVMTAAEHTPTPSQ